MTPYTNTNPCPRCGGLDYYYMVGDGYFVPQQPYQHSITINNNPTDIPYCILPLTDNTFLSFKPGDVFLAIRLWNHFQIEKHTGITEALKNLKKALNQQS